MTLATPLATSGPISSSISVTLIFVRLFYTISRICRLDREAALLEMYRVVCHEMFVGTPDPRDTHFGTLIYGQAVGISVTQPAPEVAVAAGHVETSKAREYF